MTFTGICEAIDSARRPLQAQPPLDGFLNQGQLGWLQLAKFAQQARANYRDQPLHVERPSLEMTWTPRLRSTSLEHWSCAARV